MCIRDSIGPDEDIGVLNELAGKLEKMTSGERLKYKAVLEEKGERDTDPFAGVQTAMVEAVCAGLEDTSFNKWKTNLDDAVCQVQDTEQVKRLPRFSKACEKVLDSLDIDFSDVEDELKMIFEPECVYNTLVLLVTAVKSYCEILDRISERRMK